LTLKLQERIDGGHLLGFLVNVFLEHVVLLQPIGDLAPRNLPTLSSGGTIN
jgi:hypothetical protein